MYHGRCGKECVCGGLCVAAHSLLQGLAEEETPALLIITFLSAHTEGSLPPWTSWGQIEERHRWPLQDWQGQGTATAAKGSSRPCVCAGIWWGSPTLPSSTCLLLPRHPRALSLVEWSLPHVPHLPRSCLLGPKTQRLLSLSDVKGTWWDRPKG
jgi:hypothetical protein